jgi:hypothetical protein
MKSLGEMMRTREPNPEEKEALGHVLDIALAWQRGELSTESAMRQCTPRDRYQAMRFADLGSTDKLALMALVDAILATDKAAFSTDHGTVLMVEVYAGGAKAMTNWEGKRVFVWPIFEKDGVPFFPRVDLEPGEKRREIEEAALLSYREYRKAKKPKGWGER